MSLPARERGLKELIYMTFLHLVYVAPRTGAWIERTVENMQKS